MLYKSTIIEGRCFVLILIFAWLAQAGTVANAHPNCGIYAKYTALQLRTNRDDKCGFAGKLWEGSIKDHQEWCKDVPFDTVRKVLSERQKLLEQCMESAIKK